MKKNPFRIIPNILAIAARVLVVGMVFAFVIIVGFAAPSPARAFAGPGQTPPNGTGAIGSDSSNNVSIGTSTPVSGTKLLVVGASSDNTTNVAQFWASNNTPIFLLRSDGSVSIETSTVSAGNTVIGGNLTVGGTFVASTLTGTMTAGNISSGQFGSNTGGGNYSFGGNVGIGTTSPGAKLDVGGSSQFSADIAARGSIGGTSNSFEWGHVNPAGYGSTLGYYYSGGNPYIDFNGSAGTNINTFKTVGKQSSIILSNMAGGLQFGNVASASADNQIFSALITMLGTGNVGIGTATPSQKLEVVGNVSSTGICLSGVCDTTWPNNSQWTSTGTAIYYNGGNVGIGTTAPGYGLDVETGSIKVNNNIIGAGQSGTLYLGDGNFSKTYGSGFIFNSTISATNYITSGTLQASGVGTNYMLGNVGIATTTPAYKLDVNGAASFEGNPIHNVGTPTSASDAATKSYVDSAFSTAGGISGSGGANYVPLFTGASSLGNSAIYQSGSNVGIGTTNPLNPLDITGVGDASTAFLVGTTTILSPISAGVASLEATRGVYVQNTGVGASFIGNRTDGYAYMMGGGVSGSYIAYDSRGALYIGAETLPNILSGTLSAQTTTMTMLASGNVGIGQTAPAYTLDVNGTGNFTGVVNVGTPVAASNAATKSYVDSVVGGGSTNGNFATLTVTGNWNISGAAQGGLNMNGYNITGVNTLAVTTIDPAYQIGGTNYETFAPSIAGVQDEVTGDGTLTKSGLDYEYVINFPKLTQGSDLWVWYQTVDFSKDTVEAIATPYGQFAEIYYTINGSTLTFHGNAPAQFSFRLTGKRFDWQKWPTKSANQSETPGFVLPVKD